MGWAAFASDASDCAGWSASGSDAANLLSADADTSDCAAAPDGISADLLSAGLSDSTVAAGTAWRGGSASDLLSTDTDASDCVTGAAGSSDGTSDCAAGWRDFGWLAVVLCAWNGLDSGLEASGWRRQTAASRRIGTSSYSATQVRH